MTTKTPAIKRLNATEAVQAFIGVLISRDKPLIFSNHHNSMPIKLLAGEFIKANDLPPTRDGFEEIANSPGPDSEKYTNDPALSPNKVAKHWTAQEVLDAVEGPLLCLSGDDQLKVVAKLLRVLRKQHELRIEGDDKMVADCRRQIEKEQAFLFDLDKVAKGDVVIA